MRDTGIDLESLSLITDDEENLERLSFNVCLDAIHTYSQILLTILLTTQFYSHITHKTTHIGVHYARFCTYFVGENDGFYYVFNGEK